MPSQTATAIYQRQWRATKKAERIALQAALDASRKDESKVKSERAAIEAARHLDDIAAMVQKGVGLMLESLATIIARLPGPAETAASTEATK